MQKAFCGLLVCYLLFSVLISNEAIVQQNEKNILESKQRIIEYQQIEQKRVELLELWEKKIQDSLSLINPTMKTPEAMAIFCGQILLPECFFAFEIDVYQQKAKLIQDISISKENYKIIFPRGSYFYAEH